jgi:hypothetical protein
MTFAGTVVNGVIVLDSPNHLPEGARVEVFLREPAPAAAQSQSTLAERLLRLAGTVNDLPSDMARNHDHYLHGAPKR